MKQVSGKLGKTMNFGELEKLFRSFFSATGMDVTLYNADGDEELSVKSDDSICRFVTEREICREHILFSGRKAAELKKTYIYEAPCGLVRATFPLFLSDVLAGFITIGPISLWDPEDLAEGELTDRFERLGILPDSGFRTDRIKTISCDTMNGLAELLMLMVRYMSDNEQKYLAKKAELDSVLAEQQEQLSRDLEKASEKSRKYPLELEKELISYVYLGDKEQARSLINNLLTDIFLYAGGDLSIIRAKLYELMAFFSRTAVEAGAEIADLTDIVRKSTFFFTENLEYLDLCSLTIELLDEYLDTVYKTRNKKTSPHLAATIALIQEKYSDSELTLEEAARRAFVSPYYLSHTFRSEMNTTFINYLTRVRIDHAKRFLLEGKSVEETAANAGFNNVSYFIRTFKKAVGVTPAKYKRY